MISGYHYQDSSKWKAIHPKLTFPMLRPKHSVMLWTLGRSGPGAGVWGAGPDKSSGFGVGARRKRLRLLGPVLLLLLCLVRVCPGRAAEVALAPVVGEHRELRYSSAMDNGSGQTEYILVLEEHALVDLLLVGGGGGGSTGGGGAGGVEYVSSIRLASGNYTVRVGDGGVPRFGNGDNRGSDGAHTELVLDGVVVYRALKGEGGAARGAVAVGGAAVGCSAGDGFNSSGEEQVVTLPAGQGFFGGRSHSSSYGGGGGGGGAGGNGTDSFVNSSAAENAVAVGRRYPGIGGSGGVGRASNITGALKFYAGGGGGATNTDFGVGASQPLGGQGGGGVGSRYPGHMIERDPSLTDFTDGEAHSGGGGGGMHWNLSDPVRGRGGSGVFVIRRTSVFTPRFLTLAVGQTEPFAGHNNSVVVTLVSNVDLTGAEASNLTLLGLNSDFFTQGLSVLVHVSDATLTGDFSPQIFDWLHIV